MKPKIWDALAAYEKAKGRKYENPTGSMMVALDNDEPARNAASELVKVARAELPEIHELLADSLTVAEACTHDYPQLAGIVDLVRRLNDVLDNPPTPGRAQVCPTCNGHGFYTDREPGLHVFCNCPAGKAKRAEDVAEDLGLAVANHDYTPIDGTPTEAGVYLTRVPPEEWVVVQVVVREGRLCCMGGWLDNLLPTRRWGRPKAALRRAISIAMGWESPRFAISDVRQHATGEFRATIVEGTIVGTSLKDLAAKLNPTSGPVPPTPDHDFERRLPTSTGSCDGQPTGAGSMCGGRGWYEGAAGDVYCTCDAGKRIRLADRPIT